MYSAAFNIFDFWFQGHPARSYFIMIIESKAHTKINETEIIHTKRFESINQRTKRNDEVPS